MKEFLEIRNRIAEAAKRAGRNPETITLVAVSKGQPLVKVAEVYNEGQRDFGENYVQELVQKSASLAKEKICWHFLGHLQKNKINKVIGLIDCLHSLDSLELATALQKKLEQPLECFLEINLGGERDKTGLSPAEALELIPKLNPLDKIDLVGLMTIPPANKNPEESRPHFKKLFALCNTINQGYLYKKPLTGLSMGMSDDFEIAIEEGATVVRIGRALFGVRNDNAI
ncbi:MAG: YggS family pyridoxal phosphate-dependent enzyme [Deltaproteobacteria bacterium]|nr:YggS family pyridoxal phosphate-dependent enzyme [Deltaproteobacteria bacterium]